MIRTIFILSVFLTISVFGQTIGTTNRLVMVDQDGVFNIDILATQAQLSTNAAAVAVAEAKAEAAASAASEGTNMIVGVIEQIASSELVVYRQGYIDSLGGAVALPPDTRCAITKLAPNIGSTLDGKIRHTVTYATTRLCDDIDPDILYSDTVTGGVEAMTVLPSAQVSAIRRKPETWTSPDGTVFPYVYDVDISVPPSGSGFFVVYLDGDASATGAVFDIHGGIAGGTTADVTIGDKILHFKGGLLTSVEEVTAP